MSVTISLALLLLSAFVSTAKVQTEEVTADFPSQLKQDVKRGVDRHTEEILQDGAFPFSCLACTFIVGKIKKSLGDDHSKEKIQQLLDNACNGMKIRLFRYVCKYVIDLFKKKLIDAIADSKGTSREVCVKLKLCKQN